MRRKSNLTLQIIDKNKGALTQKEIEDLLSKITWKDIELLSKDKPDEIKGYCIRNKYYVGPGTCVAKKFFNYGKISYDCCSCFSDEILEQLNYIFQYNYDGLYLAEWRKKQERKPKIEIRNKSIKITPKPKIDKPKKDTVESGIVEEPVKQKRNRSKNNEDSFEWNKIIQEMTDVDEPTPVVKRGRGRPKKVIEIQPPPKRPRGRPKKEV